MSENEMNEETMDEQYEDNEVVEQEVVEAAGDSVEEPNNFEGDDSQERVDWKARAIEAETKAKEYQRWLEQQQSSAQQAQQPKPEPNRVDQLRQEIQELEASVPKVDPQKPDTFWANQEAKDKLNAKRFELQEARIEAQQQNQLKMQAQNSVQSYKNRFRSNDTFRAVEQTFDKMVSQLAPHLQTNPAMLDLVRKNVMFDYMQENGNQGGGQPKQAQSKKVPQAPSGAYNQQAQPKPKGTKFRSEQDAAVASFYRMSPDEFYNEPPSPHTEGNGIQIYDIPETPRRFGRG